MAFFALAVSGSALANSQTILQCTERALPGEPINIVGNGLSGTVTVKIGSVGTSGTVWTWTTASILSQSSGVVQARVPSNIGNGLWAVEVVTPSGTSSVAYINKAEVFFVDSQQASPGSTIHIYGRNLEVLGTTQVGSVSLVPPSGPAISATVTHASPFDYTVQVSTHALPGTSYNLVVSNGFGGVAGQATAPTPLVVQASGSDPFSLGVWWGQAFTFASNVYNIQTDPRLELHAAGAGTTEDAATVQAAIAAASKAGGGVVYFPTGTYRIGGTAGVRMNSNVVLTGDGPGKSILQYGYNWTTSAAPAYLWAINASQTTLTGLEGLTIQNLNPNAVEDSGILFGYPGGGADRVFVVNCNLALGNDAGLTASQCTHLLVANNTIQSTSIHYGPVNFAGAMYASILNNSVSYRNGRLQLSFASNMVVEGNTISRDNTYMTANCKETGGLEMSSARLLTVEGNTIQGLGPFPVRTGCGEQIDAQRASTPDEEDLGTVTFATASTLTNSTATWATTRAFSAPGFGLFNRAVVAIVSGTGVGQWRTIASNTSTALTVTAPWTVIPDSTSTYTIGWFAADRQLILNNIISNSSVGINLFDGGWDCVADSNTLTNTGQILLRAEDWGEDSQQTGGAFSGRRHDVSWGDWISNNGVSNTSGNMPAKVVAYTVNVDGVSYGNNILGAELRSNNVLAHVPNTVYPEESGSTEGFWNFVVMTNSKTNVGPYSNFASLLLNNTSSNIASPYNTTGCGLVQLFTAQTSQIAP
jgi:parallel beta-helix repeat protein